MSGLHAAAPLPLVGPGQTVQLGPQALAVSAAHVPGWPQVFVPAAHVHPFLDLQPSDPGLVYRMPPVSVFAWTISAVPLGIARGAIEAFVELAGQRSGFGTAAALRDRELVQATVGGVLHA